MTSLNTIVFKIVPFVDGFIDASSQDFPDYILLQFDQFLRLNTSSMIRPRYRSPRWRASRQRFGRTYLSIVCAECQMLLLELTVLYPVDDAFRCWFPRDFSLFIFQTRNMAFFCSPVALCMRFFHSRVLKMNFWKTPILNMFLFLQFWITKWKMV